MTFNIKKIQATSMTDKPNQLLNPNLREDIEVAIRDLADIEMQKREWLINEDEQSSYWEILLHNVLMDLFQNDICLQAVSAVGSVFYNIKEAKELQKFTVGLRGLISEIGESQQWNAYIESVKWLDMVKNAKQIHLMMKQADQDNNFIESFRIFNQARISTTNIVTPYE